MNNLMKKFLLKKNYSLINYNYPEKKKIFELIKSLDKRLNLRGEEA